MHDPGDMELLRNYSLQGSQEAFAGLVRRHINLVYSAALRHTGIAAHAEEITQAVFIILARKAGRLRPDTALEAWLYETARLTALSFLRGERRRQTREQEAYMQSTLSEPTEASLWHQLAPHLDEAIARLEKKDREAVVLRYFKEKNLAEVASTMQITEAAAQSRVHRAVEKLRRIFSKRGIILPAAALTAAISAHSVQAAPPALAAAIAATAAKGISIPVAITTLVKGTMKTMTWLKLKFAAGVCLAVLISGGVATVAISQTGGNNTPTPREVVKQAGDARATYRVVGDSLEWLADTSQEIGIYSVTWVSGKPNGDLIYYTMDLTLIDSVKGQPPAMGGAASPGPGKLTDSLNGQPPAIVKITTDDAYCLVKEKKIAVGERFLVFLRAEAGAPLRPEHAISLSQPGGAKDTLSALAMNANLQMLTNGKAILRTVRERMAAHPGTVPAHPGFFPLRDQAAMKRWDDMITANSIDISAEIKAAGGDMKYDYALMVPADLKQAQDASAGVVIVEDQRNVDEKDQQTVSTLNYTIKIKGDKIRMDEYEGGTVSSSQVTDIKTLDFFALFPNTKKFVKATDSGPDNSDTAWPKVVDTGKQEKVGEYNTEIYTAQMPGRKFTFWITKDVPDSALIREQLKKLNGVQFAARAGSYLLDASKIDGMPVKVQFDNDVIKKFVNNVLTPFATVVTVTISSAKVAPVDDTEFQIPADYTEQDPPQQQNPGTTATPP